MTKKELNSIVKGLSVYLKEKGFEYLDSEEKGVYIIGKDIKNVAYCQILVRLERNTKTGDKIYMAQTVGLYNSEKILQSFGITDVDYKWDPEEKVKGGFNIPRIRIKTDATFSKEYYIGQIKKNIEDTIIPLCEIYSDIEYCEKVINDDNQFKKHLSAYNNSKWQRYARGLVLARELNRDYFEDLCVKYTQKLAETFLPEWGIIHLTMENFENLIAYLKSTDYKNNILPRPITIVEYMQKQSR